MSGPQWDNVGHNSGKGCGIEWQVLQKAGWGREQDVEGFVGDGGGGEGSQKGQARPLRSPQVLVLSSVLISQFSCSVVSNCSTPGFPVHHQLPELAQAHVRRVGDAIQLSHPLSSPSPLAFSLSLHQGFFFPMIQLFTSGGQSIGGSASTLPMNIQDWLF